MYKVDLPVNHAAEEAVARRRAAEVARKARIFNTRSRVLGVDLSALDQQVEEKKLRQKVERQREEAFDELRRSHEEALLQQERAEEERRAALNRYLIQYRTVHQRVEDSRDADLICDLQGALGPTIPEAELGPASMQVFQGEDIGEKERKRMQMENTERELRGQKKVDEKRRVEDKYKEVLIGKEMVHQDLRMVQLDALEAECNKAARIALNNYNHALAAGRAEKLRERRTREEGEGLAEMWHMVTSDMLTECAEAAERESGGGPGRPRVLTDRWRGMSAEQLREILREREDQRLERQKQLEAEKLLDAAWDFQRMKLTREAEEEEMRTEELQRETRTQMDQYNKQLAKEQQTNQEYLNKKLYTNKPTANFFNQFNTSSR